MKKLLTTAILGLSLTLSCQAALADSNVTIYHDGKQLNTQNDIIIQDGRALLGLRDYFEALNIPVNWDDSTRQATIQYDAQTLVLLPDRQLVLLDGQTIVLDVGPQIIEGHIYVPLRFLSETFGYDVNYMPQNTGKAIIEIKTAKKQEPASTKPVITTKDGLTTITHQGAMGDGKYLMTNDLLIGAKTKGDTTYIRQFNTQTGEVTEETYTNKNSSNTITDIIETDKGFSIILNDEPIEGYVGVGTPSDTNMVQDYEVAAGKYYLYHGESDYQSINIAPNGKITSKGKDSDSGLVIDIAATNSTDAAVAYAVDEDGSQIYIVDKQLTIIDKNYELLYEETLNSRVDTVKAVAKDGYFFVCALDEQTNTLYTGLYTTGGQIVDGYWRAARIEEEKRLSIDKVVAEGDNFYVLFSTNIHQYLGEYNVVKRAFDYVTIEDELTQLIPTTNGYKLFGVDDANFYLRDIDV